MPQGQSLRGVEMTECNDMPEIKLVKDGETLVRVRTPSLCVWYGLPAEASFYEITIAIMQAYPDFTQIHII